jgi:peptidyl-prolyl cis-trans isomerase SurA
MLRALLVLPVVTLAGCGVAGTQFHPGVAAQVGDRTITTRHIDQVADDYCKAVEKVSKGEEQATDSATPMRFLTHEFATDLITRAAAEQLAADYDVKPTSAYKGGLAQLEGQLTTLSDDEKDAVREVIGARSYAEDVLTQIGEISLKKQGTTDATTDDQYAEGQKLLDAWVKDHDVEINPKYALDLGSSGQVDTDLSYAAGTTAKAGAAAQPDPAYTSSLPGNFVCLD